MTTQPKIGVLTMALLEDAYNKTAHMRPAATEAARGVARALEPYGTVVHPGLVEDEEQAAAAARQFNAEDVDIIVAMELAYTKGLVPARCFLDTTAPVLVWNTQKIGRLQEEDGFDVIMLNSGMAGMPELTAAPAPHRPGVLAGHLAVRRPRGSGEARPGDPGRRGAPPPAQRQGGPGRAIPSRG